MSRELSGPSLPWWRVPMVWLVISGPAVVVVAGFITMALAIHDHDKPLVAPDSAESHMRSMNPPHPTHGGTRAP